MKKRFLRNTLCALLVLVLAVSPVWTAQAQTPAEQAHLHFDENGRFRILNFSDFQETTSLSSRSKVFIRKAVYAAEPDLVVLTGDNIYGTKITSSGNTEPSIDQYMSILNSLGVPVAIVFGNHDNEGSALSKENQMSIYNKYSVSVSYDEGSAVSGCGNYNIPIFASADSSTVRFNLWMFDTNKSGMESDQVQWYADKSNELKEQNGGVPMPSIAFQHIIVPQIYDALKRVTSSTDGAVKYDSKYYVLPDTAAPGSVMDEHPCPGSDKTEFTTAKQQGDVLAIVCGHDHINQFVVPHQGIDLICTPSAGFGAYGDDNRRGARVIDIDAATQTYTTHMLSMLDSEEPEYYVQTSGTQQYVKNIALCSASSAACGSIDDAVQSAYDRLYAAVDAANGNGVVMRSDLNGGSTSDSQSGNHIVICMGYTLTENASEAMRKLGMYYIGGDGTAAQYNGQVADGCTWYLCNENSLAVPGTDGAVNLNAGTSGNPMYFYASYNASASPITEIRVVNTGSSAISISAYPDYSLVCSTLGSYTGTSYADLNKSARGDYVYALVKTQAGSGARFQLDSDPLRAICFEADKLLKMPAAIYTPQSLGPLQSAVQQAKNGILRDLNDDKCTMVYDQNALDQAAQTIRDCMQLLEPNSFTVTFNAGGGVCSVTECTFRYGEQLGALPTVRKSRYIMDGWYTQPVGGERITEYSTFTGSSDQTWYPHWTVDTDWIAGDADQDGGVDLHDLLVIERYVAGGWEYEAPEFDHADVNWDETVNMRDIVLLRRYLAGWNVQLV